MSVPEITQADWDRLARQHGELMGQVIVYQRALSERDAEVADLREQLARCADELHKHPPDQPEKGV